MRGGRFGMVIGLAGLLWTTPAAAKTGVVIRLVSTDEQLESPVVAHLKTGSGVIDVPLLDDGQSPDVIAEDNQFSGSTQVDGEEYEITITAGELVLEVGALSWPDDGTPRDLVITRGNGALTVETATAGSPPGGEGGEGSPPGGEGSPPGAEGPPGGEGAGSPGGMAGPPQGRTPSVTFPESRSALSNNQYILIGLGLLVLAGLALLWMRASGGGAASDEVPSGVRILPQPGPIDPAMPALSEGLSVWQLPDEAGLAAFLRPFLAALTRDYRVLVVAPQAMEVPPVRGGPVYRSTVWRPIHVGDAAEALLSSQARPLLVVLITESDEQSLKDYADLLPPEAGAIALLSTPLTSRFPTVQVQPAGAGWSLRTDRAAVTLDGALVVTGREEAPAAQRPPETD